MVAVRVDQSQLLDLTVDLARSKGAVGAGVSRIVRKTGHDIEADAKVLAPVDTGALRNSISTSTTGDGRFGEISVEVGPTVEYGVYQELGTSKTRAQPFLAPAFDRRVGGFEAALAQLGEGVL